MSHAELLARGARRPSDEDEVRSAPPDGASLDGTIPTIGLPLESSRTPDAEVHVSPDALEALFAEAMRITATAAHSPVMHISEAGLALIESFEGFSPVQYDDGTGTMTIGYGTTAADIWPLPRYLTRAAAEALLRRKIAEKYEPAVRALGVPLNQHQFDALCSFVYNLGAGSMTSAWTIGRLLRAREYHQAADSMLMYDRAGGVVLLGLQRRRQAERHLFLEPMPKPSDPHHYARFIDAVLIDGLNERHTVQAFDHARAHHDHGQIARLQPGIVELRKRDWAVAHQGAPPVTWGIAWRGWRWGELNRRANIRI